LARAEVSKQPEMNRTNRPDADNIWQSVRLIVGAVVLIAGGIGLMLVDGTIHPSTALSSVFASHKIFSQSR
jgi:hypothetical protein